MVLEQLKVLQFMNLGICLESGPIGFDSKDIMYPYATSITELSGRDKKTVTDFLYAMSPTYDLHDLSGPLIHPKTGIEIPHIQTFYTTSGCIVSAG